MNEKEFRWRMNQDLMATEKLAEGINKFAEDLEKVEAIVQKKLTEYTPSKEEKHEAMIEEKKA